MPARKAECQCITCPSSGLRLFTETGKDALNKIRRHGLVNENTQISKRMEAVDRLRAKLERKRAGNP